MPEDQTRPHAGDGIDVEAARRLTPGCAHVTHFNHAGASLPPLPVIEAVRGHLEREAAIGGYEAAAEALPRIEAVYHSVARLLGCDPDEVAVVENATRAWDMAFYSFAFESGDRILTARSEYASNAIAMLQVARRTGAVIDVVDDDAWGQIDLDGLRARIDDRTRLVALTHVPTNGGLVNPAAEVGEIAAAAGVPFLLDACQSAGQLNLDVDGLGCDLLAATSRKFLRGPRGVGFLYVRRRLVEQLEPPFLDLHAATWVDEHHYEVRPDARRFENWEGNVAAKLGLGAAVDHALGWGLPAIEDRIGQLAGRLRSALAEVPGVEVVDKGRRRCGIVTFTLPGSALDTQQALRAQGINTSVSSAQWSQLDAGRRALGDLMRASVHYFNTDDEIDLLVGAVARLAGAPAR